MTFQRNPIPSASRQKEALLNQVRDAIEKSGDPRWEEASRWFTFPSGYINHDGTHEFKVSVFVKPALRLKFQVNGYRWMERYATAEEAIANTEGSHKDNVD